MAPRKKYPSPKKPPPRKRRANTMLGPDHEASSSTVAAKKAPPSVDTAAIDVHATPASKAPRLRLNMTSPRSATPFLKLNGPKSPAKQRPKPVTDSTLALIQSSSPISSQLPETLDSMPPPELPDPWDSPQVLATEKRPRPTFAQRLAGRSHSQIERSESPCFYRSSQPNFVPITHALLETPSDSQLDSEIDSQITYGGRKTCAGGF